MTPGGVTHQAIEDISLMRGLPNMTVLEVGDAADIESVLDVAHAIDGPVYIRMLRGAVPRLFRSSMQLDTTRHLATGDEITIFSTGICTEQAIRARAVLERAGVSITHKHVTTLKPFADPAVDDAIQAARSRVITIENHSVIGGLGSAVAERMAELGAGVPLTRIGIPDTFAHGASAAYLMDKFGFSAQRIAERIAQLAGLPIEVTPGDLAAVDVQTAVSEYQLEAL
jgi:transketolase